MTDRRRMLAAMAALGLTAGAPSAPSPCSSQAFEGSRFTVCRYDPVRDRFRLMRTDASGHALRDFAHLNATLGPEASHVRFAMNAGMFDDQGAPIGLYIENGQLRHALNTHSGKGNFYMTPNGVLAADGEGRITIETTAAFALRSTLPVWATQSGPMLVTQGTINPTFSADGPSRNLRNATGTGNGGTVFVISEDEVSFGKLARFMRDVLGCRDALYLDGYVSSLWAPSLGRSDNRAPLGPMLIVSAKKD